MIPQDRFNEKPDALDVVNPIPAAELQFTEAVGAAIDAAREAGLSDEVLIERLRDAANGLEEGLS